MPTSDRCTKRYNGQGISKCQCGKNKPDCLSAYYGGKADRCVGVGNLTECQCGISPLCKKEMETCVDGKCEILKYIIKYPWKYLTAFYVIIDWLLN